MASEFSAFLRDPVGKAAKAVLYVACFFALIAFFEFGWRGALSVLIGGLLGALNLWVIRQVVRSLLASDEDATGTASKTSEDPSEVEAPPSPAARGAWVAVALGKMVLVLGALWLLIRHAQLSPLGLGIGVAAMPIGIAIASVLGDRRRKP